MDDTPWIAYDLMTSEVIDRYASEINAYDDNKDRPIVVHYKPRKRKVRK